MSIVSFLLDFLFPKNPKVLKLEKLSSARILETLPGASLSIRGENIVALFDYSHPLAKEIVWQIKYAGNKTLSEKLGEILYDAICSDLEENNWFGKSQAIILLPMPVSDKRRFERGWNQAELLARAVKNFDKAMRFKYLPRQLAKVRHTESQTKTRDKRERRENLKNSMKVLNPLSVKGRLIILIDDVVTTGSTFAEAKRALKEAGAKRVLCYAVAH